MTQLRIAAASWLVVFAAAASADAQWSASARYDRGQSIQPIYEGWEKNADGTYTMWFGYLNRNWDERHTILVGPANGFEPAPADRGQPTVFHTGQSRRQMFAFKVVLPADWPLERDLVWTVTANGVAQKAIGSLWPAWMVDGGVISANRGAMRDTDPDSVNNPPVVTSAPKSLTTGVNAPVTVTIVVTDDEMPKRRKPGELVAGGGVVIPVQPGAGGERRGRGNERTSGDGEPAMRDSLRVTWVQWRGPGVAAFDPAVTRVVGADGRQTFKSGEATTKVTFDKPGTYVLRPYAEDMSLFSIGPDVTVTVTGAASSQP